MARLALFLLVSGKWSAGFRVVRACGTVVVLAGVRKIDGGARSVWGLSRIKGESGHLKRTFLAR